MELGIGPVQRPRAWFILRLELIDFSVWPGYFSAGLRPAAR